MTVMDAVMPFVLAVTLGWIAFATWLGRQMGERGRSETLWTMLALAAPPLGLLLYRRNTSPSTTRNR